MDEEKQLRLDSGYKLIQYSALAIATTVAIAGFIEAHVEGKFSFFLVPMFFFLASLLSGVTEVMNVVNKSKDLDWWYKLMDKAYSNPLFGSWYLFLFAAFFLELLVALIYLGKI